MANGKETVSVGRLTASGKKNACISHGSLFFGNRMEFFFSIGKLVHLLQVKLFGKKDKLFGNDCKQNEENVVQWK